MTGGRCHGPNCTQPSPNGDFHREPLDANPQVADNGRRSEVGEPGWLGRAFHWLFGRTS